jgi:hypothetical protein
MDFAPPYSTKRCTNAFWLLKTHAGTIKSASVSVQDFELNPMTHLDTHLHGLWNIIDSFEKSERTTMTPEEAAAEKEFRELLRTKQGG